MSSPYGYPVIMEAYIEMMPNYHITASETVKNQVEDQQFIDQHEKGSTKVRYVAVPEGIDSLNRKSQEDSDARIRQITKDTLSIELDTKRLDDWDASIGRANKSIWISSISAVIAFSALMIAISNKKDSSPAPVDQSIIYSDTTYPPKPDTTHFKSASPDRSPDTGVKR